MSVLAHGELERRITAGELILNARTRNGRLDIQPASYDLTAGRAVWKEAGRPNRNHTGLREVAFNPAVPLEGQPTVYLQPGQMLSIITHEEVRMPRDMCGTVFSKNGLALKGIFAFNAGHVDPGYEGPIVIRLINLRSTICTITLGEPIFTIVFQRLHIEEPERTSLKARPAISMEETLKKVRSFADVALSNALFDLYARNIDDRLSDHYSMTIEKIREDLGREFVREDALGRRLTQLGVQVFVAVLGLLGAIVLLLRFGLDYGRLFGA
jgi:deoxycytidine triphosphate deaminase